MSSSMKIGDLANAAHCQVGTVRYYEREGLLPVPDRSEGNYRMYGSTHLDALRFVRHCRALDMTHGEIRTLLKFRHQPEQNCEEVNALLEEHIGHVAHRIRELRTLERELKALRGECHVVQSAGDCGIMQSLERTHAEVSKTSDGHEKLRRTHR